MISYIFGGNMGELLAPRPNSNREFWSNLKAGQPEEALKTLRKKPKTVKEVNVLDEVTGMAPIHYASASKCIELVVELLSLGADVAFPSTDGSNALHYAALNERKAIIEVLLRSGADPSVPNNAGVLPIELVKTPEVRELFLRDRSSIFSPIAQTNNMLSEYMRELTASHMADKAEGSARLSGFDLNRDLAQADAENIPNGNRDAPAVDSKRTTLQKKAFGTINNSASTSDRESSTSESESDRNRRHQNAYTIVGVTPVEYHRHSTPAKGMEHLKEENPVKIPVREPAVAVGPPPTDKELEEITKSRGSSFDVVQSLLTPAKGHVRASFTAPSGRVGSNVVEDGDSRGCPRTYDILDASLRDEEDVRMEVFKAAEETTKAMQSTTDEFEARHFVIRNCQKLNEKALRKLLSYDPTLAMCRTTGLGNLAADGQTPLHAAAAFNNVAALKIFFELGSGVSAWVRDLQGRTALHVAAEKGKLEACSLLRERMLAEKQRDPIGENAPVDLAGNTPLGWATFRSKGKPISGVEDVLFKPGDRSILPRTPHSCRSGKSPWKGGTTGFNDRENLVYAFSEANGWTPGMEDRTFSAVPLAGRPAWSFFGVCDGHGGSFCSSFLSTHLTDVLCKEAATVCDQEDGMNRNAQYVPISALRRGSATVSDNDTTPEFLQTLLTRTCVEVEKQLKNHPRMAVEKTSRGFKCHDSSGSTAVLALITSKFIVVANVGDSRAVLAKRKNDFSQEDRVTAPFPASMSKPEMLQERTDNLSSEGKDFIPASEPNLHGCGLEAVSMSTDHKANLPQEKLRAEAAGATVEPVHPVEEGEEIKTDALHQIFTNAYNVKLRMSRSFGDFFLKQNSALPDDQQAVIAIPEIKIHPRGTRDAFLVLACDGVWDVMTNQEVVNFFGEKLGYTAFGGPLGGCSTSAAAEACDALLQECLARGTVDNLSVLLIVVGAPNQTSETASPSSSSKLPSAQFDLNQEADFAVVETPARRIGFETILEESGAQLSDDSHNNRRSLGSSLEQQVNTSGKKRNSRIVSRPNSAVKVDESYADYVMDDSRPSVPTTVQPARRNSRMTYSNSSSFSEDWNEPELALSTIDVDVGSTYVGINTPLSTHMKSAGDFSSPLKQLFSPVNSVEYYQDESVSSPLNSKTSSNIKKQLKFN